MDLYIQIGLLLLFLSALALFIYVYTQPAQQFTQKINEENQKIQDRLATVEGMDIAPFMNNVSTPGTSIYPLIRDSNAGKLAIFVQTKNQQGLVVNYGAQLRPANSTTVKIAVQGYSGVGANAAGTDFEQNFVTTAKGLFYGDTTGSPVRAGTDNAYTTFSSGAYASLVPNEALPGSILKSFDTFSTSATPRLMFADPTVDGKVAADNGRTFGSTGFIYTDQVVKKDMPINNNFSYADNQGSLYRFDQNASYYTTIILDANGDPIGIYAEEHGVNPKGAMLGQAMLANGTITSLY